MKPHYIVEDLREIRLANKVSQEELADRAGYNRTQVIRYEAGAFSPKLETVSNWADVLGYELILRPKARP